MAAPKSSSFERARAFTHTPSFSKLWRYASVSVITTIFSLGTLYFFFRIAKVGPAWQCNVYATAIATVPSYYLNRSWAWGKSGKSHVMRELVPFWAIAFISLVLSTLAVDYAAHEAHLISPSHQVETVLVLFANFITYAIIWVAKFLLFNRYLFITHPESKDEVDTLSSTAGV